MNKLILIYVTFCLFCGGCFSVSEAIAPNGNTHIHIQNFGWYLFDFIPLATGNAAPNRSTPFVLFRDDVTMDKTQKHVGLISERTKKKPANMSYLAKEEIFFQIPSTALPLPIPYLLTYRELQLSGELK
jgi:hypothetical protein